MRQPFDDNFPLTQGFGEHPDWYQKFGLKAHNGLDYGLPTGTPIIAPHDGKVVEAAFDPQGYGNYLKIENGKEGSVLAHLRSFSVGLGEVVQEGTPIGFSNNTGNSTGPHLHWGYYLLPRDRANGYAGFIDQLPLLNTPQPNTIDTVDDDHKRAYRVLEDYRKERLDGPEGNFEGFVRTIVGRDSSYSTIAGELSITKDVIKRRSAEINELTEKLIQKPPPSLANLSTKEILRELFSRVFG